MQDELDRRVVRALRAEGHAFTLTLTPEQIEDRLSRSAGSPWLGPLAAVLSVAVVLLVVLAMGPGRGLPVGDRSPSASASPAFPDDPCALLTAAEIAAVTGDDVSDGRLLSDEERIDPSAPPLCVYRTDGMHGDVSVTIDSADGQGFSAWRDANRANLIPFAGLGDEAYSHGGGSIHVRVGSHSFAISSQYGAGEGRPAMEDLQRLARLALVRVGAPDDLPPAPESARLWPESPLASPYDWNGMATALRARGFIIEPPEPAQIRAAARATDDVLERTKQHLADEPGADMVAVHLAVVTTTEPARTRGLTLDRTPVYVVETTGHATGNCFTLRSDAAPHDELVGACFFANRSRPMPSVTELPAGTWVSRSAFRNGSICVAIEVEEPLARSHRAWWWQPGGSGDCGSRSGPIDQTEATTEEFPLVRIQVPTIPSGSETLSLRFTGYTDDGFTLDTVLFLEVEEVDPVERP